MSFKVKWKEWRRRIVHLMVVALLVTSIPEVPVYAQADAEYVSEVEDLQVSTSGGDAAVPVSVTDVEQYEMQEVVEDVSVNVLDETEESSIVSLSATVEKDTFYYELEQWDVYSLLESVELSVTLDDGNVIICTLWDDVWNSYFFQFLIYDLEGNIAEYDDRNKYPIGDYVCKISTYSGDVSCEIPVSVSSLGDIATEISVGETISGLSGTDTYAEYDYIGGHWVKMELTEPGVYNLSRSASGFIQLIDPQGYKQDFTIGGSESIKIEVLEVAEVYGGPGTYYCCMKGHQDFDVTLTKLASLVSIEPSVLNSEFINEIEDLSIYHLIDTVTLTLADDSTTICTPYDSEWNEYNLDYIICDMEGNVVQADEYGNYPKGNYICKIYQSDSEISCEIPVSVSSLEDIAIELSVGETILGLSGTDNYAEYDYNGGHWVKMELTEPGVYRLCRSASGYIYVIDPQGNGHSWTPVGSENIKIEVDESPGTYYCCMKGHQDFDVTLTKLASLVSIEPSILNSEFIYDVQGLSIYRLIDTVTLTLEDGTTTCTPYDSVWNEYNLDYIICDNEGNVVQADEHGNYLKGNYTCKIYQISSEISCEIPVSVSTLEDVATELSMGETIFGLSGTDNYADSDYVGGHWFKMELVESGIYKLTKNVNGMLQIIYPNGRHEYYTNRTECCISLTNEGTYYFYIKGCENFDVTLTKLPAMTAINTVLRRNMFYYEWESVDFEWPYDIVDSSLEFILEDGTIEQTWFFSEIWGDYDLDYNTYDTEGNVAQVDENGKYPIGNYIFRIYQESSDICYCEIPVEIVSVTDVATELPIGETISGLSGTDDYTDIDFVGGYWFKMELTEAGTYELSKSEYGMVRIIKPNGSSQIWSNSKLVSIPVTEAGTYYCYVKGSENFDVSLNKKPEVIAIKPIEFQEKIYYELDGISYLSDVFFSVEITLDNGTVEEISLYDHLLWQSYNLEDCILDLQGNVAQLDENNKYPVGDYICRIYVNNSDVSCDIPIKIVSLDTSTDIPYLPSDVFEVSEALETYLYKLEIEEDGMYKWDVDGNSEDIESFCFVTIYYADGTRYVKQVIYGEQYFDIGKLESGKYYVKFSEKNGDLDDVTIKLQREDELSSLKYSGDELVFNYGEWGYKIAGDISGNVNRNPMKPNTVVSGNNLLSLPIVIDGIMESGSFIDIAVGSYQWYTYGCGYKLYNKDGSALYTDFNGYLANGEYLIKVTANGDISLDIPFQVVGGPLELSTLKYSGEVQEFAYGTWGYNTAQVLSGNQIDAPGKANAQLNQYLSGNNVLALDFSLIGENEAGETAGIAYGSLLWNLYKMKTYFYDEEGNAVYTDSEGYIPVGSYVMKCVSFNGVECEVPFAVYLDEGLVAEKELETAVDEILDAADVLTNDNLTNATAEEKKEAVTELLQKIEEIYAEQNISEIGAASAEKAIELTNQLSEVEKKVEELLCTSVEVVAQDSQTENMGLSVRNALLSVPAGEDAEIRVSTVEVTEDVPFDTKDSVAIEVQLVSEDEEKLQLQAPVIISMKIPEGLNADEEIIGYHYSDDRSVQETLSVVLDGNGMMSFVLGSFSTLVFANVKDGTTISGTVTSFGTETEAVAVKLVDCEGNVVMETTEVVGNGEYNFTDVEAGSYSLEVSKTDHVTREYEIVVGQEAVVQDVEIYLRGDVDGNGRLTMKDKKMIHNHIDGVSVLDDYAFLVGDVDENGRLTMKDKKMVHNHIDGISKLWENNY